MKKLLRWACALAPLALMAQDVADIQKRVTEFDLPNGLHFIIFERKVAPVAAFYTYVNAGAVNDPSGATGIAHMFEHMAFKGTPQIGTKNWPEEKKALDAVEKAYDALNAEKNKGPRAAKTKVEELEKALKAAIDKANSFVQSEVFTRVFEENGAQGMNAGTGLDQTFYNMSLPVNKAELWFLLEGARLKEPVFREFYKERDVIREEYRMRVESDPSGKLWNTLIRTAFSVHPYRNGPGGWPADIENFRLKDALEFRNKYYVPSNMVVTIVGDVDPKEMRRLADKYLAGLPPGAPPPPVVSQDPEQEGERRVTVESPTQPLLMVGYKRPDTFDKDDAVFDVIQEILSSGRTGMLYKDLVRDKQLALVAQASSAFRANKYSCLFFLFVVPNAGKTVEEAEKALYETIDKLKREKVDAATLSRVKTKLRAGLIRGLDSNDGMALQMAMAHTMYGSWKKLFDAIDDVNKVTADDVQRVAQKYFVEKSRTVAYNVQPKKAEAPAGGAN